VLAVRRTEEGIQTVDVPRPEGDGVRVQMRSAGICGSDVEGIAASPRPTTLGHEFAGVLDDGTAVAVKPNVVCGACDACRRGEDNLCRQGTEQFYGLTLDGGMAEEILVAASTLVRLPPGVPIESAGLVEPIAIGVHAVHRGRVEPGMRVLVVGAGTIGLTSLLAARAAGADVDVVARHPHQIAAVDALGGGPEPGKRYDVVIDAVGSQAALDEALERVRSGGTVVAVGGYFDPVEIGLVAMIKEATITPAMYSAHHHGESEFEQAAAILAATPHAPEVLVTHRFPLEQAAEAFPVAADKSTGAIKVQLHP
jgi:2-desacetyl-2-hydroxyethyl bacteriochlorophyllide A dehydrogenase